jgi:opacity protein-like surface antigen
MQKVSKAIFIAAAILASTSALAQSNRAGKGEIYLGPVFTDGDSHVFEGGTTARTDTGFGISLGYAYNFNSHWQAGIDFAWSETDYRATVQPGPNNGNRSGTINGTVETSTIRFNGTYHFLTSEFTPFVTGGLGWTYVDTNIPSGLPESFCWYYPWYGSYCGTYVPTAATTKFSYNAGVGVRLDVGRGFFRGLVNQQWIQFSDGYGSQAWTQYRIDFGTKF